MYMKDLNSDIIVFTTKPVQDQLTRGKLEYTVAKIVRMYKSEDRSYHGSPTYDTIYVVETIDGKVLKLDPACYTGNQELTIMPYKEFIDFCAAILRHMEADIKKQKQIHMQACNTLSTRQRHIEYDICTLLNKLGR